MKHRTGRCVVADFLCNREITRGVVIRPENHPIRTLMWKPGTMATLAPSREASASGRERLLSDGVATSSLRGEERGAIEIRLKISASGRSMGNFLTDNSSLVTRELR